MVNVFLVFSDAFPSVEKEYGVSSGANNSTLLLWLHEYAFLITFGAAVLAIGALLMSGFQTALRKLPVPVTRRQLAYLPLAIALGLWLMLVGAYVVVLLFGTNPSGSETFSHTLISILYATPLALFFIVTANRIGTTMDNEMGLWYPIAFAPQFSSMGSSADVQVTLAYLASLYALTWPGILALTLLILWETPRFQERLYRATFTTISLGFGNKYIREKLPPQRFYSLSISVDYLCFIVARIGELIMVCYFAIILLRIQHTTGDVPRISADAVQGFWYFVKGYLLLTTAYFVGKTVLLYMQRGQINEESIWAQGVLRVAYVLERIPLNWRGAKTNKLVARDPETGAYTLPFHSKRAPVGPVDNCKTVVQPNMGMRIGMVFLIQFVVMGSMFSYFRQNVDTYREGSHIQGAPMAEPDKSYRAKRNFSQHYVTLDLGEDTTDAVRDQAFSALQIAVANLPDPSNWLEGLKTLDGEIPQIPETYRIEIARPEARRVVVRSIGLHWDHAGHLAYALARYLQAQIAETLPVTLDCEFRAHRPYSVFGTAYGFLDNTIHWVLPERTTINAAGEAVPPLPSDTPIFVDHRNTRRWQNGNSWKSAYDSLQAGIDAAYRRRIGGVWVAAGTYDEDRGGKGALNMRPEVHIYGGFTGTETIRTQRDVAANPPLSTDHGHAGGSPPTTWSWARAWPRWMASPSRAVTPMAVSLWTTTAADSISMNARR